MGAPASLGRQCFAEFFGTMYLVATIIGSGMMGAALSSDAAVALLGNTLATWGILYVLIAALGPVSGAHFNPVVTLAFFLRGDATWRQLLTYWPLQFGGGIVGAYVAHAMFMHRNGEFDGKDRDTDGEFFAEIVATVGLLGTIFGFIAAKADVAMGVGLFITAGYWFTSSTSFANPAVTIARSFTDTFASISPKSFRAYLCGQLVGLVVALPTFEWLFFERTLAQALATLARRGPGAPPGGFFSGLVLAAKTRDGSAATSPTTPSSCSEAKEADVVGYAVARDGDNTSGGSSSAASVKVVVLRGDHAA